MNSTDVSTGSDMPMGDVTTDTAASDASMPQTEAAPTTSDGSNVVFVGSLAWATDDASLRAKFEEAGLQIAEDTVKEDGYVQKAVVVVKDRETGRSRGYGFVSLVSPEEAQKAVDALNNVELDGRTIRVQIKDNRPRMNGGRSDRGGRRFGNRDDSSRSYTF